MKATLSICMENSEACSALLITKVPGRREVSLNIFVRKSLLLYHIAKILKGPIPNSHMSHTDVELWTYIYTHTYFVHIHYPNITIQIKHPSCRGVLEIT